MNIYLGYVCYFRFGIYTYMHTYIKSKIRVDRGLDSPCDLTGAAFGYTVLFYF